MGIAKDEYFYHLFLNHLMNSFLLIFLIALFFSFFFLIYFFHFYRIHKKKDIASLNKLKFPIRCTSVFKNK